MTYALALDIGGSHVTAAAVDLQQHRLLGDPVRRHLSHAEAATTLLDGWAQAALAACLPGGAPLRVGVAMPHPFDMELGVSHMTHKFLALLNVSVREELTRRWQGTPLAGLPLQFGNDADLFVLGEWWGGAAQGRARVMGITLGTGIGSGFVVDGRVVTDGPEVPPEGELNRVPYRDADAETALSSVALVREYQRLSGEECTVAEIAALAGQGDPRARQVFQSFGERLGEVLSPWVQRFQPETVVVGGNVSRAWELFIGPLQQGVSVPCVQTTLFETASLLGAAALGVREQVKEWSV
ncbi:ROK family protein [Deinococcus sonorensis]|uniref:ROK family protein n=2 Tax=Deinococcus sonorensis TaxID=309891 RepID=A0AAU7UHF5_9DEIO